MAKKINNSNSLDKKYIKLAFEQASVNLGSTGINPSVGCVVVKNNSIISSGYTSINGRPHAEPNALSKKINYKNAKLYVTLEPCNHYNNTPSCIKKIIKKKINKVVFSINDIDPRSKNKATNQFKKKNIVVKKFIHKNIAKDFYKSYFLQASKQNPLIDAKLAISKDNFTINKKKNWITNSKSRKLGNFLRSKYNCLLTTSKTINKDNPLLNCRTEGLENKTPSLVIIDRFFKIKKNIRVFNIRKRKIYILTTSTNILKENFLKKKGIKILKITKENIDLKNIFLIIKKLGFNRIFVETGATFIDKLLSLNLVKNLYLFRSSTNLFSNGQNNSNLSNIKKIKTSNANKVKVNLNEDSLFKVRL